MYSFFYWILIEEKNLELIECLLSFIRDLRRIFDV